MVYYSQFDVNWFFLNFKKWYGKCFEFLCTSPFVESLVLLFLQIFANSYFLFFCVPGDYPKYTVRCEALNILYDLIHDFQHVSLETTYKHTLECLQRARNECAPKVPHDKNSKNIYVGLKLGHNKANVYIRCIIPCHLAINRPKTLRARITTPSQRFNWHIRIRSLHAIKSGRNLKLCKEFRRGLADVPTKSSKITIPFHKS